MIWVCYQTTSISPHTSKLLHILYFVASMNQTYAIIDLMLVFKPLKLEQPYHHNISPLHQCSLDLTIEITYAFNKAIWSFKFMMIHMRNKVTINKIKIPSLLLICTDVNGSPFLTLIMFYWASWLRWPLSKVYKLQTINKACENHQEAFF